MISTGQDNDTRVEGDHVRILRRSGVRAGAQRYATCSPALLDCMRRLWREL